MQNSSMSENIAGEITTLFPPFELFNINFRKGSILFKEIISGLGEILPLDNILYYEVPYIVDFLLENIENPDSVVLLFSLKNKLNLLTQNDEYIFDLDKNTKNEIFNIRKLLNEQHFWSEKVNELRQYIEDGNPFLYTVLDIVREENIKDFADNVVELTKLGNETLICEAIYTLKKLGMLNLVDKSAIKIENQNLRAIAEQHFA